MSLVICNNWLCLKKKTVRLAAFPSNTYFRPKIGEYDVTLTLFCGRPINTSAFFASICEIDVERDMQSLATLLALVWEISGEEERAGAVSPPPHCIGARVNEYRNLNWRIYVPFQFLLGRSKIQYFCSNCCRCTLYLTHFADAISRKFKHWITGIFLVTWPYCPASRWGALSSFPDISQTKASEVTKVCIALSTSIPHPRTKRKCRGLDRSPVMTSG